MIMPTLKNNVFCQYYISKKYYLAPRGIVKVNRNHV